MTALALFASLVPVVAAASLARLVGIRWAGRDGVLMVSVGLAAVLGGILLGVAIPSHYEAALETVDVSLVRPLVTALAVPVSEELGKGLVLFVLYLARRLPDRAAGLAAGLAAGGGFAAVENWLVATSAFAAAETPAWAETTLVRAVYGTIIHVASSGIVGVALARSHEAERPPAVVAWPLLGVVLAVVIHGAWNLSLSVASAGSVAGAVASQLVAAAALIALGLAARSARRQWAGRRG